MENDGIIVGNRTSSRWSIACLFFVVVGKVEDMV